jgi:hypothetical protein
LQEEEKEIVKELNELEKRRIKIKEFIETRKKE